MPYPPFVITRLVRVTHDLRDDVLRAGGADLPVSHLLRSWVAETEPGHDDRRG